MNWRVVLCLLLGLATAQAQATRPGVGTSGVDVRPGIGAATAPYVGPGDIVSGAKAWWGLRGYNAAYSGNAVNVCNASDATCVDMVISSGVLVITTVGGTDCGVSTCTIKTFYDQSGGNQCTGSIPCNMTQATEATRYVLTLNCIGSKPCATVASADTYATVATIITGSVQPYTFSIVGQRTGNLTGLNAVVAGGTAGSAVQAGFGAANNLAYVFAGTTVRTATAADSAFHAIQYLYNGASSSINVDNTTTAIATPGTAGIGNTSTLYLGAGTTGNNFVGQFTEAGYWASAISAGNQTSINANQHSYWGF